MNCLKFIIIITWHMRATFMLPLKISAGTNTLPKMR